MPAAAVASFTPAIAGISGTWVGASGEMADDMGTSRLRVEEVLSITSIVRAGRAGRHESP
jgi:hypothetical protein